MARVSKFSNEAKWYAPDIDDNRQDPDPFKVKIEPMTAREFNALQREAFGQGITKAGNFLEKAEGIKESVIKKRVVDVYGYSVETPAGVVVPHNGAELYSAVLQAGANELVILDDIFAAIQSASVLEAGLVGKSSAQSGSSTQETKENGAGDAANAGEMKQQPQTCQSQSGEGLGIATTSQTPISGTTGSQSTTSPVAYGQS